MQDPNQGRVNYGKTKCKLLYMPRKLKPLVLWICGCVFVATYIADPGFDVCHLLKIIQYGD
jgi:hypothetical protein